MAALRRSRVGPGGGPRSARRHEAFGRSPEAARRWALGTDHYNADPGAAGADRADLVVRVR